MSARQQLRESAVGRVLERNVTRLIDRRVAVVGKQLTEIRRELDQLRERAQRVDLLLGPAGRGTERTLSPSQLAGLQRDIVAVGGDAGAAERDLHLAFRLLVHLEALGVGRIAGGTANICGKLATIPLLGAPNDDILEIGTLYGLFAAALLRMSERAGGSPALTIVDPLVGTQLQLGESLAGDPSGAPVTERAVRTNLGLAGAAGEATRIVVGLSGDPEVLAQVADRQYGVIVVDGDHGYDGVAADLTRATQLAAPGALVVLDDYGDWRWPGVQQALEDHLAGGSRLELLGRVATSGFLRAR